MTKNHARECGRLRRALHRERFTRTMADEPGSRIEPELVRQIDLAAHAIAGENEQMRQAMLRQKAEFENFRRRTLKEKDQLRDTTKEALVANLLPVIDNFDRAIDATAQASDVSSVRQGVEMVAHQLRGILENEGFQRIDALGETFDPVLHEAIAVEDRPGVPDNEVIEVMLPGYRFKDRVVRPAMVKVAKHGATP